MKTNQLQHHIFASIGSTAAKNEVDLFPLKKVRDLKALDKMLDNPACQKRLQATFALATTGSRDAKTDIRTILAMMLSKKIQLKYSLYGKGKTSSNKNKKRFDSLNTYTCLLVFIKKIQWLW